jgi:hypothetical protein
MQEIVPQPKPESLSAVGACDEGTHALIILVPPAPGRVLEIGEELAEPRKGAQRAGAGRGIGIQIVPTGEIDWIETDHALHTLEE